MQNRYACDVGDFGKLGMLRLLEKEGLTVGVNWYLVEDESHNNDGKHIGYMKDKKFFECDDELLHALKEIIDQDDRSVYALEEKKLLKTDTFFSEILCRLERQLWHKRAVDKVKDCDIVFLDPDNGLLPPSVGRGSDKSIKYVLPEEIIDYYKSGHSVVFYNHRTREQLNTYLERFTKVFNADELAGSIIKGISYKRGTVRDYFFVLKEEHVEQVERVFNQLSNEKWGKHFQEIM